jgi:hypothetical protein
MARNVYFDPFGSYAEGFDRGAGRQIQTEGAARTTRAQDYDFNTLAPYRLNAVQREDELGKTTLPYQQALAPFALDTARTNRFDAQVRQGKDFATLFNTPAPLEQLYYQHYGITPTSTSVNGGPPSTELFMNGQNGQPVSIGQQPNMGQSILDYLNWQRDIQSRQLQNTQQYQQGVLQNTANRNDAYQTSAEARMFGARARYYQNAGGINGGSLFGSNMPADLMQSGYFADPNAQPQQPQQNPQLQDYNLGGQ